MFLEKLKHFPSEEIVLLILTLWMNPGPHAALSFISSQDTHPTAVKRVFPLYSL